MTCRGKRKIRKKPLSLSHSVDSRSIKISNLLATIDLIEAWYELTEVLCQPDEHRVNDGKFVCDSFSESAPSYLITMIRRRTDMSF